jgi:hypothetical protein
MCGNTRQEQGARERNRGVHLSKYIEKKSSTFQQKDKIITPLYKNVMNESLFLLQRYDVRMHA